MNFDSTKALGAWAELAASELLLLLGYEVFRNVAQSGPHDVVVRHRRSGKLTAIDITLGRWRSSQSGLVKALSSSAAGKLRSGQKDCVLVITPERELFRATHDMSKGLLYEQVNGYPVVFSIVTADTFK